MGFYLDGWTDMIGGAFPTLLLVLLLSFAVAAAVFASSTDRRPPPLVLSGPLALLGFVVAASWIDVSQSVGR